MSFKRKETGNTIQIITSKDFMLSAEVSVMSSDGALHILSLKKIRRITSAENKDGKIHITRHYCTCPLCGKRFSAYANSNLTKSPSLSKNIVDLCDNQLSLFPEEKIKTILFNQPMKIGNTVKCPYCGFEGLISNGRIGCLITDNQNQLSVSCNLQTIFDIMAMSWLPKEMLSFDDVHCSETVTFNLQNGTVTASLNCGKKTLCAIPVISSITLGKNDPWLQIFSNKRIFREIKRSFIKVYGALPFSDKALTIDNLILLTKFVGYHAEFYRDLPLSIDDKTTLLPEEFESISDRIHYSDSVPSVFSEINIPKAKSIKRIIFNRPSILLYEKELERLWKIIDNIDLFCELLNCNTFFAILDYFHLYPGIDPYLIDLRKMKGVVWLQKMLVSNCCDSFCSLGIKYLSANSTVRCKLLKIDFKDDRCRYSGYYGGQFYFSVPMPVCMENRSISVEYGYQFVFLTTLKDYYIAGSELHNCLDTYSPYNDSQVYIIRKLNKTIAAIEISENHIFQAFCRNNTPISSKPLINAIIAWADHNSYSIDDDVFDT